MTELVQHAMKFWVFAFCVLGVYGQSKEEGTLEYKMDGMEVISFNDVAPAKIDSESQDAANNSSASSEEDGSLVIKRLIETLMQATADNSTDNPASVEANSTDQVAPHTINPGNVLIHQLQSLPSPVIDQLLNLLNVSFSDEEDTTDNDNIESTTVMEKIGRSASPEPYFLPVAIFSNSSSGSQVVTSSTEAPSTTMTYNRYEAGSDNATEGYVPDYFVFAVLRNGTIIRKRPNRVLPNVFYLFLEDGTLVQRFPNGSTAVAPMGPIIQVTGFDTREFPQSGNGNETETSLANRATVDLDPTPGPLEIRLGLEDAAETVGDLKNTTAQTTTSSEGTMETTISESPSTTSSTTQTASTTSSEEMTVPPFTNPIETEDELVITEAATLPTMTNASATPAPSGRSLDLLTVEPLPQNITSPTPVEHLPQNFHLKDEEKHDLLLIESLIKKQQAVLEQLTTLTKLRLENAQPQQGESLAQRVLSTVVDMTTAPVEPSSSTTTPPSTVMPIQEKKIEAPVTRKQIQLLIRQLEEIRKNPEKVKRLDLGALKKLQKFENLMTAKTNQTKTVDLLQAPEIREQLSDYAVNISKTISSFFGSALQDASEKFVSSLRTNSSQILSNLTAG